MDVVTFIQAFEPTWPHALTIFKTLQGVILDLLVFNIAFSISFIASDQLDYLLTLSNKLVFMRLKTLFNLISNVLCCVNRHPKNMSSGSPRMNSRQVCKLYCREKYARGEKMLLVKLNMIWCIFATQFFIWGARAACTPCFKYALKV